MNAARYDGTAPTSPNRATLAGGFISEKPLLIKVALACVTGRVVGHIGNDVGAQVATFHRNPGTDQGLQRRGGDDERVGDVLVPPGHHRSGDLKGQLA